MKMRRIPILLRAGLIAIWMGPYFALLVQRMGSSFMPPLTWWEMIGRPAAVVLGGFAVLSAPSVTATPTGLKFWPFGSVEWDAMQCTRRRFLGFSYLRVEARSGHVHHVILNGTGGEEFADIALTRVREAEARRLEKSAD